MRWTPHELWENIKLVHCGLDQQFLRGDAPPPVSERRLVCVGRLCVEKAQLLLIHAVKKLRDCGVSCEIVFVGDGPMRTDIELQIEQFGLADAIQITGWASGERVKYEIASARALVLPSFAENLPVVIMEAMALGRPVISTYVAGIPELVRPDETGWLTPASNEDALVVAMSAALTASVGELERMGLAGRKLVKEQHDILIEAAKLKGHFASALAQCGGTEN